MRKYKNLKLLAVVTAAAMALSGCGGTGADPGADGAGTDKGNTQEASVTDKAQEQEEDGQKAASPESSGDNTLSVAIQANSFITDYDDNYLTHYLEEKLGIEIEFSLLPTASDEVATKVLSLINITEPTRRS